MSIILKLGIQGIRSFSELDLECITFDSPVTLIVGPNGSGKTTIIECLKMASAGILPPNCNNGRCFVHDPKYANTPEVKGQIRMLFRQSNSAEILAIRSFQLTRTKTPQGVPKLTFKALESVLKTGSGENRQSLSHRCADMDVKVPLLMGVSRAILENVIFCHQEESNWPLQEQAVLKKKFDAIFGATRYTKALKNIADIRSDMVTKQKEKKGNVDVLGVHMDQVKALRKRDEALKAKGEEQKKELAQVEEKIGEAQKIQQTAEERRNKLNQMAMELENTKQMEHHYNRERAAAQLTKVLALELPQLQHELQTAEARHTAVEREKKDEYVNQEQMERELEKLEREREVARNELGELSAAAGIIAMRKEKQQTLWRESGIFQGQYEGPRSLQQVQTYVRNEEQALAAARGKKEEEEQRTKQMVAKSSEDAQARKSAYDQAAARCSELQRNLERVSADLTQFHGVEQELEQIKAEIRGINAQGGDDQLQQLERALNELDKTKSDLQYNIQRKQESVRQLELQSEQLAEIDVLKKQAQEADAMVAEHKNRAPASTVPVDTSNFNGLKQRVDNWLAQQRLTLDTSRRKAQEARSKVLGYEAQERCALDEERQQRSQIEAKEREIGKITIEEADAKLAEARESQTDIALSAQWGDASSHLLNGFLRRSREKCELCKRAFANEAEKQVVADSIAGLKSKLKDQDCRPEDLNKRKAEAEQNVAQKQAVRETAYAMHQLNEQLKATIAKLESIGTSKHVARREADAASQEVEAAEAVIAAGELWRVFATELERLERHALTVHQTARDKASMLVAVSEGGASSLAEERAALARFADEREACLRKQESMRNDQRALTQKKHNQEKQMLERQKKEAIISAKVERKRFLVLEQGKHKQELEAATAPLGNLKHSMEEADRKYRENVKRSEERQVELNDHFAKQEKKVADARNFEEKITELQKDVEHYEQRQKHAEEEQRKLAKLDQAVDGCKTKLARHKGRVQEAVHELQLLASQKQVVLENINVKQIEQHLAEYVRKRQQMEQQIGAVDVRSLQETVDRAIEEVTRLKMAGAEYTGAIKQVEGESALIHSQLKNTMYTDIEERHRYAVLDNELSLIVIQDLHKYHTALDKALMKFHASKMTDINKLVRDMWRQVYRGRDIEYIQIRSDADDEKPQGQSTGTGSRSHNYRVVMIHAHTNTELDMRGRCSAGQKVLASLIIRLALADAFGCQCGVLSLDEPTTNLDSQNIEALAQALADLIRVRSVNEGFQLMIITHDETFVGMLARHQVCDRYWRVSKDDTGHSKVAADDIRRLMG